MLRRGEPVSYDEVVRDVASELKIEYSKVDSASGIENKVLEMLVEKLTEQAKTEKPNYQGSMVRPGATQNIIHLIARATEQVGIGHNWGKFCRRWHVFSAPAYGNWRCHCRGSCI